MNEIHVIVTHITKFLLHMPNDSMIYIKVHLGPYINWLSK
jgi:hypothetical protein